jgi:hypothetical protein
LVIKFFPSPRSAGGVSVGGTVGAGELVSVDVRVGVDVSLGVGELVSVAVRVSVGVSVDVNEGIGVRVCVGSGLSVIVGVSVGGASATGVPPRLKMLVIFLQVDSKVIVTRGLEAANREMRAVARPMRAMRNWCLL